MRKKFLIVGSILSIGFFGACDKIDTACDVVKPASALVDELNDSIPIGVPYSVPVSYVLDNSCGKFYEFETTTTNNNLKVKLFTKYEGCNCDQSFTEENVQFELLLDTPGTYTIDFWVDEDDYNSFLIEAYQ